MKPAIYAVILCATVSFSEGCSRAVIREEVLTYSQATNHCLSVPAESTNIHFATSGVGLGGRAHCFRLQATVSNMLSHLRQKVDLVESNAYAPLSIPAERPNMKPYGLEDLSWFDVENIRTGYISHAAGDNSTVWIDAERQLYYYYWTD